MTQKLWLARGIFTLTRKLISICPSFVGQVIGQVEKLAGLEKSLTLQGADLFQAPGSQKESYLR